MVPNGTYASRELISILEGIIELNQFKIDDQVTKTNKLKGITEITLNLDELNNSVNLKDGRPSNSLLTYYVTDDKDFPRFEPQYPQYKKLKDGEFTSLTLRITLYNVCSVHRGVFSTSGDTMSTSGGYHEYIGGCSVHRGDIMMNVGGYHEYIGGCSVHRRDTMSTSGGYHEYIGGCSVHRRNIMIHVGEQLDKILSISIENSDVLNIPRCTHDIPRCTHDIPPMYSWYPPDVLMVSPRCTEHPPMY